MAPIQPFKRTFSPADEAQHNGSFDITPRADDLQPWAADRRLYNRETGFAMDEIPSHPIPSPSENLTLTSSSRPAPAIMRHAPSVGSESRQAGSPDYARLQENAVEDLASVASTAPCRRRASVY